MARICSAVLADKPTVSLEDSCRRAAAVLVVEPTTDARTYKVLDVLHDSTGDRIKKDQAISVDLKGMVYEKGRAYVFFIKPSDEAKRYQAVEQMRTGDGKEVRRRVLKLLADLQEKK
jgi:hypothetical protein